MFQESSLPDLMISRTIDRLVDADYMQRRRRLRPRSTLCFLPYLQILRMHTGAHMNACTRHNIVRVVEKIREKSAHMRPILDAIRSSVREHTDSLPGQPLSATSGFTFALCVSVVRAIGASLQLGGNRSVPLTVSMLFDVGSVFGIWFGLWTNGMITLHCVAWK